MNRIAQLALFIIGLIILVGLFAVGLVVFSYLLIIGAILGLVIFTIAYVRARFFNKPAPGNQNIHDHHQQQPESQSKPSGRVIEHDQDDK